jgi:hypothetical protein
MKVFTLTPTTTRKHAYTRSTKEIQLKFYKLLAIPAVLRPADLRSEKSYQLSARSIISELTLNDDRPESIIRQSEGRIVLPSLLCGNAVSRRLLTVEILVQSQGSRVKFLVDTVVWERFFSEHLSFALVITILPMIISVI